VLGTVRFVDGVGNVVFPAFVKDGLGVGAIEFGWLATAQAMGALAGSFFAARAGKVASPSRLVTAGFAAAGAILLAMVSFPTLPVALVLQLLMGGAVMAATVGRETMLQSGVRDRFRGRVFGTLNTTNSLAFLGGMGLGSALGTIVGAAPVLALAGGLYVAAGAVALALLPGRRAAVHGAEPA